MAQRGGKSHLEGKREEGFVASSLFTDNVVEEEVEQQRELACRRWIDSQTMTKNANVANGRLLGGNSIGTVRF